MQVILLAALSLVGIALASVEVQSMVGYHERVAIPLATRIKAAEEYIQPENRNSRIANGIVSKNNAHPYYAGLLITYANNPGIGVCGAVLVSQNRLVTAAHCWFDAVVQAIRFVVVLGSNKLFSGGDRIATSTVITYPGWTPAILQNNIAMIILQNRVILTANIQPIALARNATETYVGEWATAVGYGFTSEAQTSVPVLSVLREADLQVISVDACRTVFPTAVLPNTICTNGTGGVGTCKGDGGGPLVITRNNRPHLIGVITFRAASGCERGFPSGYSRITSFLDFIELYL